MNNLMKFEIVDHDEYANYVVRDIDGNDYEMNINFMNMEEPKVGTTIYFNKSLLDEKVSINLGFIEDDDPIKEDEFVILMNGDKKIYLKRYYG